MRLKFVPANLIGIGDTDRRLANGYVTNRWAPMSRRRGRRALSVPPT
jgi:hypothetical protein